MKKLYVICLLSLFWASSLSAKQRRFSKNYFGIYAGINVSGFAGEYQSNTPGTSGKYRLRTQFGFYGNIYIQREFSIYTALELVLKGSMTKGEEEIAGVSVSHVAKTNLTTFSLPVLFGYAPRKDWSLMIGPQATYLTSAKEPFYKSDFYKPDGYREDVLFKFNQFTMDGVVAINYLIMGTVTFQLRYTHGIMSVVKSEFGGARNSSFLFYVGYNFPPAKK